MADLTLVNTGSELEQLRESQRELYACIGKLSAECVQQVALLRRLIASRPGGVCFNKWESEIYRVLNESTVTEQMRSEMKSVGVIEFAGMLRSEFQDTTRTDTEKQSARQFAQTAERFARHIRTGKPLPGIYFASDAHLANALYNVSGLHEISVELIAEDVFSQHRQNDNVEVALIVPLPVERDEDGCWTHPDYAKFCGDREFVPEREFDDWIKANRLVWRVVYRSDSIDGGPDEGDFSGWEPEKPEGDGWFVGSIHDTENGAVCIWLRHGGEVIHD
jgi:hypothetical protein